MRTAFGGLFERLGAVLGRENLVTLADEVVTDEFEDVDLVVNQQDAMTHSCRFQVRRTLLRGRRADNSAKIVIFRRKIQ